VPHRRGQGWFTGHRGSRVRRVRRVWLVKIQLLVHMVQPNLSCLSCLSYPTRLLAGLARVAHMCCVMVAPGLAPHW
jgi:hypothetical protein